jgi:intracellular multiplication protein IcmW
MPDLHNDAINAFWDSYDRRTLYRVIVSLERVEHWAIDQEADIEPALLELGRVIDMAGDFDITKNEGKIIRVLTSTHASRAMRILQALDLIKPGTASQLLMYAEEDGEDKNNKVGDRYAKLFLRRNLVFERLQLLSRIFSPQRISLILKALEYRNESNVQN